MQIHYCVSEDGSKICLCDRGVDHTEDLFDVPVGEEESK